MGGGFNAPEIASYPKYLLSFAKNPFSQGLIDKMSLQSQGSQDANSNVSQGNLTMNQHVSHLSQPSLRPIEEEKHADQPNSPLKSEPADFAAPIYQANDLDQFLKVAFDVQNEPKFRANASSRPLSYGAKIIVAGNDITLN